MKIFPALLTLLLCAAPLCFAQTPDPQFKLELEGEQNDFILNGQSLVHTNETAAVFHDAEIDRLAFRIVPHDGPSGGNSAEVKISWHLTVERPGARLRQGQYPNVISQANDEANPGEDNLILSVHPDNRICIAGGSAEIRIIDLQTVDENTSLEKFKIDFELRCTTEEPKLRGSFTYNWAGDEPFKLDPSQVRARSNDTYSGNSRYERNAVDGNIHSYWLTKPNSQRSFRFNRLTVTQQERTPYQLSRMNVIFYADRYAPNWFYYSGSADEQNVSGRLPRNVFGTSGGYPAVNVNLGNLRFSGDGKFTALDLLQAQNCIRRM